MASVTFPPALGGDGSTVTDDANPSTGLANGGHRTRFVPALAQAVAVLEGGIAETENQVALAAAEVVLAADQVALAAIEATNAATSAANAAMSAGATAWVSGTTYAIGDTRYSPITNQVYRRKIAGAGTTDPSADSTNWALVMLDALTNYPIVRPTLNLDFANSKAVDPRITFTRASTAAYYDGRTVAKAEENLLLQSQTFDNASWTKSSVSITANATTAPDGTTTADKLIEDSSSNAHAALQEVITQSGTHTYTVYAKAAERSYIVLYNIIAAVAQCFDLAGGTVGASTGSPTSSIISVGNGWYRCVMTHTATAVSNSFRLYLATSNTVSTAYLGDGVSGLYIWGAQLEKRSTATTYTPTTTQDITNYIPQLMTAASGVPRIDHDPITGECRGLLIEESRTNLLTYSEQFDNAAWIKSDVTVTANATTAPDGTLTADTLIAAATTANHQIRQSFTPSVAGQAYTLSFYAKAAGVNTVRTLTDTAGWTITADFDLMAGTSTGGTIAPAGNGWYRCSVTGTVSGVAALMSYIRLTSTSFLGNGFSGVHIWGAQLEAGAFPTSYIPTTAAQVTRSADAASMTGVNFTSWYRTDEGTLYIEALPSPKVSANVSITDNSATSNAIRLIQTMANTQVSTSVRVAGVSTAGQVENIPAGAFFRATIAYKTDSIGASINGSVEATDTSSTIPVVDRLVLGADGVGGSIACAPIKKIAFYPKRLTDSELVALTA